MTPFTGMTAANTENQLIDMWEGVRTHLAYHAPRSPDWIRRDHQPAETLDLDTLQRKIVIARDGLDDTAPEHRREAAKVAEQTLYLQSGGAAGGVQSVLTPALLGRIAAEPHPERAARIVSHNIKGLKGIAAFRFLQEIGLSAVVPAGDSIRFVERLGLVPPEEHAPLRRASYFRLIDRTHQATLAPQVEIDRSIALFSGAWHAAGAEPVCATRPRCDVCPLTAGCKHYREVVSKRSTEPHLAIRDWAHDERPRERLLKGNALADSELLAILLRTGSSGVSAVDIGRQLIKTFGTLHRLEQASAVEIAKVKGVGTAKAATIKAALELGKRASSPELDERTGLPQIGHSRDVFHHYRARFKAETQEHLMVLLLNSKNRVMRADTVTMGTVNSSPAHPRELFRGAIRESAAAVIFLHNHPSGDPTPSRDDREATRRLVEAGKVLGIRVLDHVIIGADTHYSFADNGEIS